MKNKVIKNKRLKDVCIGVYYNKEDCCLCDGMHFEFDGNINIFYNQEDIVFEDCIDYEKNIHYSYEEISKGVFKAFEAYLKNKDYKVIPSTNVESELSSHSYCDNQKYYEIIIDSRKYIYSIFEISKFECHEFIPTDIMKKIIESLNKAGYKKIDIAI